MVNGKRIAFVGVLVLAVVAYSGCGSPPEPDTAREADTPASVPPAPPKPEVPKSVADFGPWLHDPSTMWFDNGYFMVLSSGYRTDYESRKDIQGLGIDMWYRDAESTEWKHAQNIFTGEEKPKWWAQILDEGTFWAPDAPAKNVMYYSFEADNDSSSVIARAVASGTAPNLEWKDDGIVVLFPNCRDEGVTCPVAIDPSVFSDAAGGMYLTFGSGTSGIWIAELDPATGHLTDEAAKGWSEDNAAWHHVAYRDTDVDYIEAPYSFRHPTNGYYYLFVNWGGCCRGLRSTYNIRVGRSEYPTGPYLDKEGVDLVDQGGSLVLETEGRYIGPGHASIYRHTDGRFVFTFHYYDGEDAGKARMAARILNWVDDWPVVTDTDFFETLLP